MWQEIRETVDSQIEVAGEDEEGRMVLAELKTLKERLEILQRTGRVAEHPAAAYDKEIRAALARVLPSAEIIAEESRSREIADFVVRQADRTVLVESKWRAADEGPFRGSTLARLTANIDPKDRLLVVSNSTDVSIARRNLDGLIGARGRVVSWRSPSDDAELARTLISLLAD